VVDEPNRPVGAAAACSSRIATLLAARDLRCIHAVPAVAPHMPTVPLRALSLVPSLRRPPTAAAGHLNRRPSASTCAKSSRWAAEPSPASFCSAALPSTAPRSRCTTRCCAPGPQSAGPPSSRAPQAAPRPPQPLRRSCSTARPLRALSRRAHAQQCPHPVHLSQFVRSSVACFR
jgi:hypothetical protein